MKKRIFNVLFLCTGNSARSIIAEACLKRWGADKFNAYSAGSQPKGVLHPMTIKTLQQNHFNPDDFSSKSWDVFAGTDAPVLDIIFTVCDNAANESCPIWPGHPMTVHWGIPDPAKEYENEKDQWNHFQITFNLLEQRVKALNTLPSADLEKSDIHSKLIRITSLETMSKV